jgi:hypothetical protein
MAIGTPNPLGSTATTANATSRVLTTTANAPANNVIIVGVLASVGTPVVTDSAGNTYTALGTAQTNTVPVQFFGTTNSAGLASGGTITVSISPSSGRILFGACSVSGLSLTLDGQNGRNQVATAWTSNSITTTNTDNLLLSLCGDDNAATNTPGASWTEVFDIANLFGLVMQYQIVAATGTYTASGTKSVSTDTEAKIIALKAGGAQHVGPFAGTLALVGDIVSEWGTAAVAAVTFRRRNRVWRTNRR